MTIDREDAEPLPTQRAMIEEFRTAQARRLAKAIARPAVTPAAPDSTDRSPREALLNPAER